MDWVFKQMADVYAEDGHASPTFDHLIGYVGALEQWSIFKARPTKSAANAQYIGFDHSPGESHLGLQFLLTGILSVHYDPSRNQVDRLGFTAFPSHRNSDRRLGKIACSGLR